MRVQGVPITTMPVPTIQTVAPTTKSTKERETTAMPVAATTKQTRAATSLTAGTLTAMPVAMVHNINASSSTYSMNTTININSASNISSTDNEPINAWVIVIVSIMFLSLAAACSALFCIGLTSKAMIVDRKTEEDN